MMIAYKLTDADGYTRRGMSGETRWEVGATVAPAGDGSEPCGPGVLHLYASALEASLCAAAHTPYGAEARLFEVEASPTGDDGLKLWTTMPVLVLREIELPEVTTERRVAWAFCIAPHETPRDLAIRWLSGEDRSIPDAEAAAKWSAYRVAWARDAAADTASTSVWSAAFVPGGPAARLTSNAAAVDAGCVAARAARAGAALAFRARSLRAFERARRILAGELPAEQYDQDEGLRLEA